MWWPTDAQVNGLHLPYTFHANLAGSRPWLACAGPEPLLNPWCTRKPAPPAAALHASALVRTHQKQRESVVICSGRRERTSSSHERGSGDVVGDGELLGEHSQRRHEELIAHDRQRDEHVDQAADVQENWNGRTTQSRFLSDVRSLFSLIPPF